MLDLNEIETEGAIEALKNQIAIRLKGAIDSLELAKNKALTIFELEDWNSAKREIGIALAQVETLAERIKVIKERTHG